MKWVFLVLGILLAHYIYTYYADKQRAADVEVLS